jgi:DNA modification methylase
MMLFARDEIVNPCAEFFFAGRRCVGLPHLPTLPAKIPLTGASIHLVNTDPPYNVKVDAPGQP